MVLRRVRVVNKTAWSNCLDLDIADSGSLIDNSCSSTEISSFCLFHDLARTGNPVCVLVRCLEYSARALASL